MSQTRLPDHWRIIGTPAVAAVRIDHVSVDLRRAHYVVTDSAGIMLCQRNGQPRRFKSVDHAAQAADMHWPLESARQKNMAIINASPWLQGDYDEMLIEVIAELGFDALTDVAVERLATKLKRRIDP